MERKPYIILGHWSDCVGTDYCDALGWYTSEGEALEDAADYARDRWEPQEPYNEDDEFSDEGPDYYIEVYNPDKHDMLRAGGGTFQEEFNLWKEFDRLKN